ncbi:MAG: efflux RND transporter permease subunit, partial [bacterium]
ATMSAAELFDLADLEIKPLLEQVPNVSVVNLVGGTKREIRVSLDRRLLKERELSVTGVSARIAGNSQNVPVGAVSRGERQVLFRTLGEYRTLDQIRRAPVSFFGSEVPVTVAELGSVEDATQEVKAHAFFNGRPAIFLDVYRQSGTNSVAVVDAVHARLARLNASLAKRQGSPAVAVVRDNAKFVRLELDDVRATILIGICLTLLVVYLFLGNIRSTFITGMALPNSLIGTFILMFVMGFTINSITLLALSLAVGLLIDDAIVVRENIWRHMEQGEEPRVAAVRGTNEVLLAVVAPTLTVVSVFMPVGFLSWIVGQFFKQLGFTVVFAMGISLFDALTMAPLLSAYLAQGRGASKRVRM